MASRKSRALIRGAQVYDRVMGEHDGEFSADKVRAAMHAELSEFQGEAYSALVDRVFKEVDRKRARPDGSGQQLLFDCGGVLRLGGGRRIAKAHALLRHAKEALEIDDENRHAVVQANDRKHKEIELLTPFWKPEMTMQEAVAAYKAHQESAAVPVAVAAGSADKNAAAAEKAKFGKAR